MKHPPRIERRWRRRFQVAFPLICVFFVGVGLTLRESRRFSQISAQYRAYWATHAQGGGGDEETARNLRSVLLDFVRRPHPLHRGSVEHAYEMLTVLAWRSPGTTPEELTEIGREILRSDGLKAPFPFFYAALALADREMLLDEAMDLVEMGSALQAENPLASSASIAESARGWIEFKNNRLDTAEVSLLRAADTDPTEALALYNLGRFYQHKTDLARTGWIDQRWAEEALWDLAEDCLAQGMSVAWNRDWTNPNEATLRDMYDRVHGTQEGFEDHLEVLARRDPEEKRKKIIDGLVPDGERLVPFELLDLDGRTVKDEDYAGQVLVLKFWGTWCSPCIAELLQFQLFYERYADSADVAILTVCEDEGPEHVRRWMSERGYDFPVLMNTDYADRVGIPGWPTTSFVDRNGNVAFETSGAAVNLLQEYTWRVEALR